MIKLFSDIYTNAVSNQSFITNNGLGYLTDAITCVVTEERNGSFELEMSYPVSGILYDEIKLRNIIVTKPNPYDNLQLFRIYYISKPMNGVVTINASHISYDLSGYPVKPFEADNISEALDEIRHNIVTYGSARSFTFETDKSVSGKFKITTPISCRALLGGTQGSILDVYGTGEYEFNNDRVYLHLHRGTDRGVTIRYGKNMTDFRQEENCSNVYTGVYPYWYSEEQDTGGYVETPRRVVNTGGYFNFSRILVLDLSLEFETKPTPEQLQTRAEKYIADNKIGVPKVSIDVSFYDLNMSEEYDTINVLERVKLCDTLNVEFPEMGVTATAKCIKTVYDAITDKYTNLELGDARTSLADTIASQNDYVKEQIDLNTTAMERAIQNATQLITGGLGGYVIIRSSTGGDKPDEVLIMDTPDIATARNVWRWNRSGLGFSRNGYNGPFETAITQDGSIVASFITTGTLNANLITAGYLSADRIKGGRISSSRFDSEGLVEYKAENYNESDRAKVNHITDTSNFYVPTYDEFAKYDIDGDGMITSYDAERVYKLVDNEVDKYTFYCGMIITPGEDGSRLAITENGQLVAYMTRHGLLIDTVRAKTIVCNDGDIEIIDQEHPHIDFRNTSVGDSDYTSRIIEWTPGELSVYDSIVNASDRSLKKDIEDMPDKYIDILKNFDPKIYRFKKNDILKAGFIAQDVEETMLMHGIEENPLVSKSPDGLCSLDYNGIIAMCVKCIQDLYSKIER